MGFVLHADYLAVYLLTALLWLSFGHTILLNLPTGHTKTSMNNLELYYNRLLKVVVRYMLLIVTMGSHLLQSFHQQLANRFNELRRSVERFVPHCFLLDTARDVAELAKLSAEYRAAEQLIVLRWFDGHNQYDLVQCCTNHGGSVDALLNCDTFWH